MNLNRKKGQIKKQTTSFVIQALKLEMELLPRGLGITSMSK